MVELSVGINTYQAPTTWSELNVSKAIKLSNLCKTIPEVLKARYDLLLKRENEEDIEEWKEGLTEENLLEDMPNFYRDVCKCLTDIEEDLTPESAANLYHTFFEVFVIGVMYNGTGYEPVKIGSFKFKDKEYFLPSDKRIMDVIIPMYDLDLIQFAEASDMLNLIGRDGYKFAPTIIAVLCLTKGEIYNEDVILQRAKEFEELDMATVWDVFFCLMSFVPTLKNDLRSYLVREESKQRKQEQESITHGADLSMIFIANQGTYFSAN